MVGTVAQIWTRSRSISSNAFSGVNLPSIITARRPPIIPTTRPEWVPETWNSGDVKSATGWGAGGGASSGTGVVIDESASRYTVFWRLAIMDRWVLMAPLGRPV